MSPSLYGLMPGFSPYNNPMIGNNPYAGDPRLSHLGAPVPASVGNQSPVNNGYNQLAVDTSREASRLRQVQDNEYYKQIMQDGYNQMQKQVAEALGKGMKSMGEAFTKVT